MNFGFMEFEGLISLYVPYIDPTVDGRNPAPVDMVNVPLFTGLYTSQVVQDFFHQQYGWQFVKFWVIFYEL